MQFVLVSAYLDLPTSSVGSGRNPSQGQRPTILYFAFWSDWIGICIVPFSAPMGSNTRKGSTMYQRRFLRHGSDQYARVYHHSFHVFAGIFSCNRVGDAHGVA